MNARSPVDKWHTPMYTCIVKVIINRNAQKYLDRLDFSMIQRIDNAIAGLAKEPPDGDIKKLRGAPLYRLRVGGYRILFTMSDTQITIVRIAPRGDAYKGV